MVRLMLHKARRREEGGASISVWMEDIGIEAFSICSQKKHGAKVLLNWIKNRSKRINGARR